ncbi:phosphotyrosine protein phosphatase [Flexivirga endophytica]|uniref:Phosphotyrosine protein phosphatase n=1 Tax=Flexivirga endophytica TaxID=1849103 RepID=A0A916WPB6_9MICO|nr:tyrosine-protein phosphatase [Flexivirga endophytica]GGB17071.1 phosphotyrosine protein phosphatase [Flexivirga endophytica]GHB38496.1 phosphotyrosine protein phosphatase [Flexivirga endophytica]
MTNHSETQPAWIDLDGVANMRDLGGLPAADGHEVQPCRLVRSDNLQDLTEADIQALVHEHGVTDIVDLRSDVELRITGPGPLREIDTVTHHHHSLFPDDKDIDARDVLVLPWHNAEEPERNENPRASHYLGYLDRRPDSVAAALDVIATSEGATVVHCAAGKDRTGTVVAMALSVAGVPREAIIADYAASTERTERIVRRLEQLPGYSDNLRGVPMTAHHSRPETIARVLEAIDADYGSVAGWLRSVGWSESRIKGLRAKLVD